MLTDKIYPTKKVDKSDEFRILADVLASAKSKFEEVPRVGEKVIVAHCGEKKGLTFPVRCDMSDISNESARHKVQLSQRFLSVFSISSQLSLLLDSLPNSRMEALQTNWLWLSNGSSTVGMARGIRQTARRLLLNTRRSE